ncbi:lysophospholipid acyltransferase family protein [Pelosinus sp. sgz500959]|uniref:lysophospholipid acyltransferase family protein n=1 Tax=Pelosinus sp. sgz500959 TaxID=3242472 RepID=UPI00366DDB53
MVYQLVKIVSRIVCMLPPPIWQRIGKMLGAFCWLIVPTKRKKMAKENIMISLSLDPYQATEIAKRSTTRFGKMFMEVLNMPNFKANHMKDYVHYQGCEYLDEALKHGKGAILATAHSGNWELLGAALAMYGFPLIGVAQKQTNAEMDKFINEYRRMSGMHITYKTGVREMVKMLGEGRVIGLIMDQDAHSDGVMVEFFGRLASTPQGAAALARMKDSPIVPAFITENTDGTHNVVLHPAVWVERTDSREEDIRKTTQELTRTIEHHVRQHPHEWFWLHNRWKNTPQIK